MDFSAYQSAFGNQASKQQSLFHRRVAPDILIELVKGTLYIFCEAAISALIRHLASSLTAIKGETTTGLQNLPGVSARAFHFLGYALQEFGVIYQRKANPPRTERCARAAISKAVPSSMLCVWFNKLRKSTKACQRIRKPKFGNSCVM